MFLQFHGSTCKSYNIILNLSIITRVHGILPVSFGDSFRIRCVMISGRRQQIACKNSDSDRRTDRQTCCAVDVIWLLGGSQLSPGVTTIFSIHFTTTTTSDCVVDCGTWSPLRLSLGCRSVLRHSIGSSPHDVTLKWTESVSSGTPSCQINEFTGQSAITLGQLNSVDRRGSLHMSVLLLVTVQLRTVNHRPVRWDTYKCH